MAVAIIAAVVASIIVINLGPSQISWQLIAGIVIYSTMLEIALEMLERNSATQRAVRNIIIPLVGAVFIYAIIRLEVATILDLPLTATSSVWLGNTADLDINIDFIIEVFLMVVIGGFAFKARPQWIEQPLPAGQIPVAGQAPILVASPRGSGYRGFFYLITIACFCLVVLQAKNPNIVAATARITTASSQYGMQKAKVVAKWMEKKVAPEIGHINPKGAAPYLSTSKGLERVKDTAGKLQWIDPDIKVVRVTKQDGGSVTMFVNGIQYCQIKMPLTPDDNDYLDGPVFWTREANVIWQK